MTRLLITRPMPPAMMDALREAYDVEERESTLPLEADELRRALRDFDAVACTLRDQFSAEVFADVPAPRARLLANFGVGYNHIDVDAARNAGVTVTNTPGAVTDATADIAMMLILMSARRASQGEAMVRQGDWSGWHPTQLLGMHLGGKTVGIAGMGRIGQAIAHRCVTAFGMRAAYFSRSEKSLDFDATRFATLKELAANCDILVSALPATPDTHHLFDADIFAAMRPHAHFINIARGDIVNESALIDALKSGQIAGAGLDVYEHEPKVPQALIDLPNVSLLPHLGTAALEVREGMGAMVVENLRAFFAGETPPNTV